MTHHSSYISQLFYPKALKKKVIAAGKVLKQHKEIKAIACRGISGLGFASALSLYTGLPLAIVRKPEEDSHSDYKGGVETDDEWVRKYRRRGTIGYCVVDDLISSGHTIRVITYAITSTFSWTRRKPVAKLIILYHDDRKSDFDGITVVCV